MTSHILRVTRLHIVNKWSTIGLPLLIMGFIFIVNLAIWIIIAASTSGQDRAHALAGTQYSGASFYIFVYMLVVAIQAVNITFPFALGYGVTRREFWLGSALTFVILAVLWGALLTLLSFIEQWTHGWFVGGHMFTAIYFGSGPWFERLFVFTAGMLFVLFIGSVAAAVFVRWKANGLTALAGILIVLGVAAAGVITFSNSWAAVGRALASAGTTGIVAWLLVPTVIAGFAGYAVLRRATPRGA